MIFLALGCLLIVCSQVDRYRALGLREDQPYRPSTATGHYGIAAMRYFYFFYYTGVFPVATSAHPRTLEWNAAAARRALEERSDLVNEDGSFLRTGDLGKIFLLYPSVWVKGTPRGASLVPFNRALWTAALLSIFLAFGLLNHRMLGTLLVLALVSSPFQHTAITDNNVFGYPTAIAALLLGLHAPVILGRWRGRGLFLLALGSGIFLGCVREVRTEPILAGLAVAATYLTVSSGWGRRAGLVAVLVGSFAATGVPWARFWDAKFEEAHRLVAAAGGTTYDGPWNRHHVLWHSLWCGLGDFGEKYGYSWSDLDAFAWAIPEVNRRFGTSYRYRPSDPTLLDYYTPARHHRILPETLDEYNAVVRSKVLGDVTGDPLWYASVLAKRVVRILTQTAPLRLRFGTAFLDLPLSGWLLLPVLVALVAFRQWPPLLMLAYFGTTSLPALLVYSGGRFPYASAYPMMLFALLGCWLVNAGAGALAFEKEARRKR